MGFALFGIAAAAAPARAQSNEGGWFEPADAASSPDAAPQVPPPPGGGDLPSLPPSPLLEEGATSSPPPASDADPRALSDFRPTLDPYGSWQQHPTYGTVWVPHREVVGANFAPYVSSGRWALDEHGDWVWMSDYPFGGVVFHYGRWVWMSGAGWAWVPGYRYAPAWVSWRVPTGSYAYVGWAPLGPDFVWFNGSAVRFWYGVSTPWVFCPSAYVFDRHVHYRIVRDRALIHRVAANTRRYSPAQPSAGVVRRASYARAPSLTRARVPAHAVPRERLRASGPDLRSRSVAAPGRRDASSLFAEPRSAIRRADPAVLRDLAPRVRPQLAPAPERAERVRPERRDFPVRAERPRSEAPRSVVRPERITPRVSPQQSIRPWRPDRAPARHHSLPRPRH